MVPHLPEGRIYLRKIMCTEPRTPLSERRNSSFSDSLRMVFGCASVGAIESCTTFDSFGRRQKI